MYTKQLPRCDQLIRIVGTGRTEIASTNSGQRDDIKARFQLEPTQLQRADAKRGRASIRRGVERLTGQTIILKHWAKSKSATDAELREIWRQEMRQLQRLAGFPGAREFIVGLLDSVDEPDGYYLVLSPGQRAPLGALRKDLPAHHYLKQPRAEKSRLLIWSNMRRIAEGLEILHTQGLLHRNLDEWAIFTDSGDIPDFQLSGFEWSIRLSAAATGASKRHEDAGAPPIHSFLQDWNEFGLIVCSLLGVDPKTFSASSTARRVGAKDTALHLTGAERNLLYLLLRSDSTDRVDGELVDQKIGTIIAGLEAITGKRESHLVLTCLLGPNSPLTQAIRAASGRTIEADDLDAQLAFVNEDLREEPILMVIKPMQDGTKSIRRLIAGSKLTYWINAYQPQPGQSKASSWAIAYSHDVRAERPAPGMISNEVALSDRGIKVISMNDARRTFATLQGRAPLWDRLGSPDAIETGDGANRKNKHRALLLIQVLEALITVSDIWPVVIEQQTETGEKVRINLRTRSDAERERLSTTLGMPSPTVRMKDTFAADATSADEDWVLTDVGTLGERDASSARWRLVELIDTMGEEVVYGFEGLGPVLTGDRMFLRKADHAGEDKLLRRRIRALKALKEHVELLDMLDDPRTGIRRTHEAPVEDAQFRALDDSKQDALRAIWASTPLYLLQGPPGVGKTRLVRELVGRRIREDGSSRILLTAQSHHAVDHLLEEVSKELANVTPAPLVVRSRSKDRNATSDRYDVREQATAIISKFKESAAVKSAPMALRAKVDALVESFTHSPDDESAAQGPTPDRSIEALLLRSAHFVFASTNAGDLERLIEERSQFDWTIIEEAGKATGTELISPLLLSHRRLMIGDHKQLPPFNADRLRKLLSDPSKIQEALEVGASLVGRPFREAGMEQVIDDPDAITSACGEAAAVLMMFETLVETELALAKNRSPTALKLAQRLNQQHRMHPAIARLVSESFYDKGLLTDATAAARFASSTPPFRITDRGRLPASPIVVIDMPFVQATMNAKKFEKMPRYHNPTEVEALIEVLKLMRADEQQPARPSLAVLAPYREQVKKLMHKIGDLSDSDLKHLRQFSFEGDAESPVGTVDSFQGSEADIVVMSLVRNNHHAGLRSLGFLADSRRMNVLLSRARWKLVLVCSLDFLRSRISSNSGSGEPLEFLKKMLGTMDALQKEKAADGTPLASVVKYEKLMGKPR